MPMKLLTRYVLLELIKVFLVALAALTGLIVLVGAVQEAVRQGLSPVPVLQLIPYILPDALRFALPATVLFAVCTVYGRMSSDNEVVAAKSVGISPVTLIRPALVLAFLLSLVGVWLNDIAVSWGRAGVHRVIVQSVEQIAYGMLRTQRSYATGDFSIHVQQVDGRQLVWPTITFQGKAGEPPVILTAERAELRSNPAEGTLSVFLDNGTVEVGDDVRMVFPDRIERVIPLADASERSGSELSPSHLPLRDISKEALRQEREIARLQQQMAAEAGYQLLTGDFRGLADPTWQETQRELEAARERLYRLQTEPWRRWANGFSCFFFVLVGAPLAVRMKNSDLWTSFALSFLPVLILYYPLLMLGVDRAKSGALPPYCVWLGNVILAVVGLWLLRKVVRY